MSGSRDAGRRIDEARRQVELGVPPDEACRRLRVRERDLFRRTRAKAGATPPPPASDLARAALAAAHAVAETLASATDLDDVGAQVLRALGESMGWDFAALWRVSADGEALECVATWREPSLGSASDARTREERVASGRGVPGRVLASGASCWIEDLAVDPEAPREGAQALEGLHGALAFPVRAGGAVTGVVELLSRRTTSPEPDVVRFLECVGTLIGPFVERRRAEAGPARSEVDLADFFENAPVGFHGTDERGVLRRVNRRAAELLGYEPHELVGRPVADLHVDESVAGSILARLVRGETLRDVEACLRCKDGSTRWVRLSTNASFEDGRFSHSRCVLVDVTQRRFAEESLRASEERTRAILENALDAYVAVGADGKILGWNPQAERMFRRTRTEALGRLAQDTLFAGAERQRFAEAVRRVIATGDGTPFEGRLETTALRADGSEFPAEVAVTPVRVGDEWTFHAFVRDVTDRRAVEGALRASERASRRRAEALQRLAAAALDGSDPFVTIAATLADTLGARHVVVAEVVPGSARLRSLASWTDGRPGAIEEQPLPGSAADEVVRSGVRFVRVGARDAFPGDDRLRALGAEAFLGAPLTSADGSVRGVLWAANDQALDESFDLVPLFELFARRAAVELDRRGPPYPARPEDRLRSIVGRTDSTLSTVGLDGCFTAWSAPAADAYGFEAAQMLGRHLAALFTPEDVAHGVPARLLRLASAEGIARHDGWCVTSDGARVWTELTLAALRRDSGEVYGFVLS